MRKRSVMFVVLLIALAFVGGAAAATGLLDYTATENNNAVNVSYGEVDYNYQPSLLDITDHNLVTAGNSGVVQGVDVSVQHTGTSSANAIDANVSVYFVDSAGNVVEGATNSSVTFNAASTSVVRVDLQSNVKPWEFSTIQLEVEEV
jgi:hypothetical protein